MNPERFLELAVTLKGGQPRPEFCRTSISRAYYAAFLVVVEVMESIGIGLGTGGPAHGSLRNCLGNSEVPECHKAGRRLQILHARRIKADYRMRENESETASEAAAACKEAAEIIRDLKAFKDDDENHSAKERLKQFAIDVLRLRPA
jgi:hypothetical protein